MVSKAIVDRLRDQLTDPELLEAIQQRGEYKIIKAGDLIMDIGRYIKYLPVVLSGAIKILREDDEGNELFLYFIYPGQSCAMSINCCMANAPSEIRAVAEEDTEIIMIPVDVMDEWTSKYQQWKQFVMNTYSFRFNELLHTIDSIAFRKLDERLMHYLEQKASISNDGIIHSTHQKIAYDLNSSREVISRLLKQLEKNGKIELSRNRIRLRDQSSILE